MEFVTLPVKFDGFEIGTIRVRTDGFTDLRWNDTPVAREVRMRFFDDDVKHLSIKPRT